MEHDYNMPMKIEGPGKSSTTKGVSRTGARKGADDTSFSGLISGAEETSGQSPVSGAVAVGHLDALLALQESGDSLSGGGKKAREKAEALLDQLDRIRMGLLAGEVPQSALQQLSQSLQTQRERIIDPHLADIIDEIDLRVQVELAKFGR